MDFSSPTYGPLIFFFFCLIPHSLTTGKSTSYVFIYAFIYLSFVHCNDLCRTYGANFVLVHCNPTTYECVLMRLIVYFNE